MSMSSNFHPRTTSEPGYPPARAHATTNGHTWLSIEGGDGNRIAIFMPTFDGADEAARAMADTFNAFMDKARKAEAAEDALEAEAA